MRFQRGRLRGRECGCGIRKWSASGRALQEIREEYLGFKNVIVGVESDVGVRKK